MDTTYSDLLTRRFYEWEYRGRGWHACNEHIDIEPPFYPFLGHYIPAPPAMDDSKRHTLVSKVIDLFRKKEPMPECEEWDIPPIEPHIYKKDALFRAFNISMPKDAKVSIEDMQHLLLMLSDTLYPISFEIVATEASISLQLVCRSPDAENTVTQVAAYFPDMRMTDMTEQLEFQFPTQAAYIVDFGLAEEFMFPLRTLAKSDADPYIGLFASIDRLGRDETCMIQVLFKGTTSPWPESIIRASSDNEGKPFFSNAPEILKEAREKISAPLLAVCVRVAGFAPTEQEAVRIVTNASIALERTTASQHNRIFPLPKGERTTESYLTDFFMRKSHRLGMLLNSSELTTMVHIPTEDVVTPKLARDTRKTKAMPEIAYGHDCCLGVNYHDGFGEVVTVPASLRLRHTHIIGATGTGKSTLLHGMIVQDMELGNGFSVLDPHGDLIESIMPYVPKDRIQDIILIDPADGEYPVGFNILSAHSEIEKDILSSDLVSAFKRLSTSWGDQMNSVFANAILAFLESPQGGTLADVRRFLIEKGYREAYLKTVSDPHIVYYWQHEYPLLKSGSVGSILTRLDTFLRPKLIRNMVAQRKGLDFEHILDSKKILLVKLSQGLMGGENSYLLGTFFVSKMYQAAMARQAKSKQDRSDFFLYIDEFQNFITPSMSYILSGARKYHLGLILAHQDMQQLQRYDSELASSVMVNAGTRICFRLGDTDAKRFASGFSYFDAQDLENLKTGEAIARIEQPNLDFNLATVPLEEIEAQRAQETIKAVIDHSRSTYGTPRHIVEESLQGIGHIPQEKEPMREKPVIKEEKHPASSAPPLQPLPPIQELHKPSSKVVTQHRYLQTLIKKMAQSRGYKATLEEVTPDGNGRIDVSLEKDGKRIACEISVTTGDAWEIHNVEKCIAAGYDTVIVCSNDAKNLGKIRKQLENRLDSTLQAKVLTLEAQEVIQYFDAQSAKEYTAETVIKGYRVKVEYDSSSQEETAKKQMDIAKAITGAMRKKGKST